MVGSHRSSRAVEACRQFESNPGCPERPDDTAPCLQFDLYAATTYCKLLDANDTYYCAACKAYRTRLFEDDEMGVRPCPESQAGPVPPVCTE